MKRKTFLLLGILVLLLSTVLAGCGGESTDASQSAKASEGEKKFTFKFGHTFTEENHKNLFAEKLGEILEEKSNGSITLETFPSSQLGNDLAMMQALQAGTQELTTLPMPIVTNFLPEAGIFDLPYLFDSQEQAEAVLAGEVGDYFFDKLEEHGFVGLGYIYPMERSIFSKVPIKTAEDFNGLKIRVQQAPGYVKTYEVLGTQPSVMAYSEVFTALQQGVVDASKGSPDQIFQDGFHEIMDYLIRAGIHIPIEPIVMSKKVWDQLSPEQQEIVREASEEAFVYQKEIYLQHINDSLDKLEAEGIEIIDFDEVDAASIKEVSKAAYDDIISSVPNGQELYEMIEKAKAEVE